MIPPTSKSAFLDRHLNNTMPRSAADADPVVGGQAVDDHKARQEALKTGPFINAVPKFSTGPKAAVPTFPTKTANTLKFP